MSTITREFTKEQLQQIIETDHVQCGEASALARIALASLEAEPVCVIDQSNLDYLKSGSDADVWPASRTEMGDVLLYRAAPPAPVSVPDEDLLHMAASAIEDLLSNKDRYCAGVWADIPAKLRRAAMLQGADGTLADEGTIPAMLFKPVADLYGLTSPTGGETSFTFDAVEARDFIDGGWSCQEYVELERFQEAITNHTEDKLAMVDHSGDSNNMVEPVTTAYKLPDDFDFDHFNDPVWFEAIIGLDNMYDPVTRTLATVALELNRKLDKPELTVWYGAMPESNGKTNWTAILHRKGEGRCMDGFTIDRSEYPGRVLYAADRVRYLIGEKSDRPSILDYDAEAHSGYVRPGNSPVIQDGWVACSERIPDIGTEIFYFCQDDDLRDCGIVSSANFSDKGDAQLYVHADGYDLRFGVDITHWMPLPPPPLK